MFINRKEEHFEIHFEWRENEDVQIAKIKIVPIKESCSPTFYRLREMIFSALCMLMKWLSLSYLSFTILTWYILYLGI
jgi:hypothetical protein